MNLNEFEWTRNSPGPELDNKSILDTVIIIIKYWK